MFKTAHTCLVLLLMAVAGETARAELTGVENAGGSSGETNKESTWDSDNNFAEQESDDQKAAMVEKSIEPKSDTSEDSQNEPDVNTSKEPAAEESNGPALTREMENKFNALLTLDQKIKDQQAKIERLQQRRDSKKPIRNIESLDEADSLAEHYEGLVEKERDKRKNRKTWNDESTLPLPDRSNQSTDDSRSEFWRDPLVDELRSRMQEARDLIDGYAEQHLAPDSIAEALALDAINRALLDVYLVAMRLRLMELQWDRESLEDEIELVVAPEQLKLSFVAWDKNPELEELIEKEKGIIPGLKFVYDKFSAMNPGSKLLLATMNVDLRCLLLRFGARNYDLTLHSNGIIVPNIPNGMQSRPQLLQEKNALSTSLAPPFIVSVTPEMLQTIRQKGFIDVDVNLIAPLQSLSHWRLVKADQAKIRIQRKDYREESDSDAKTADDPKTEDLSDGDSSDADPSKTDTEKKSPKAVDEEGGGEDGKEDNKGDNKGDNEKGDSGNSSDQTDTNKSEEDQSDESSGKKPGKEPAKDPEDESGSKVGTDEAPDDEEADDETRDEDFKDDEILSPNADPDSDSSENGQPNDDSSATTTTDNPSNSDGGQQSDSGGEAAQAGNWLTATEVRELPERFVGGLWKNTRANSIDWFDLIGSRLVARPASTLKGMHLDIKPGKHGRYYGRAYTVPVAGPCTKFGYWQPAALAISNGVAGGEWKGKKVEEETCQLGELPDGGPLRFKRLQVIVFVPLAHGKLMHMTGSPAVGRQNAQFKATARIGIQSFGAPIARTKITFEQREISSSDGGKTFDFVTDRPGRHQLFAELYSAGGKLIHQQNIRIDVPEISGVTR